MELISPNQALERAKNAMLDGRDPESADDWVLVMNCIAAHLEPETAGPACELMRVLYDMPLSREEVTGIVVFQLARRDAQWN